MKITEEYIRLSYEKCKNCGNNKITLTDEENMELPLPRYEIRIYDYQHYYEYFYSLVYKCEDDIVVKIEQGVHCIGGKIPSIKTEIERILFDSKRMNFPAYLIYNENIIKIW